MKTRTEFLKQIGNVTHADRAIALLWYYRETHEFDERSATELAADLREEGFAKINVSRLDASLRKSRFVVRGRQPKTFQINLRLLTELNDGYDKLLSQKKATVIDSIIPASWVAGTRSYLEQLVHQINGNYQFGFYDGCATLCRRLMEILIIEVYITQQRHQEIQSNNGVFLSLENLISYIQSDKKIVIGRNNKRTMNEVKFLGDSAAHDRTYITRQEEIEGLTAKYRRMVDELMLLSGIKK